MPESIMLRFVQLLPQASPKGDFFLKDLPGSGKRIDVLCRDLAACFEWGRSSWPKSDLELIAVIGNSKIVKFKNPKNQVPQGEVGWAILIRDSLKGEPPSFVEVTDGTVEDVIRCLNHLEGSELWVLDEKGASQFKIESTHQITQNSFMLGDHRGFDTHSENIISQFNLPRVSLGKKSYLSSHCLATIISEYEKKVRIC
ncbi:MAG: hypothetical protein ACFFDQ_03095 [Candidatus Thorarchaeota archaeon]